MPDGKKGVDPSRPLPNRDLATRLMASERSQDCLDKRVNAHLLRVVPPRCVEIDLALRGAQHDYASPCRVVIPGAKLADLHADFDTSTPTPICSMTI